MLPVSTLLIAIKDHASLKAPYFSHSRFLRTPTLAIFTRTPHKGIMYPHPHIPIPKEKQNHASISQYRNPEAYVPKHHRPNVNPNPKHACHAFPQTEDAPAYLSTNVPTGQKWKGKGS